MHNLSHFHPTPFSLSTIAWMAGLLEGEGYFYRLGGKLGIRLVMTDRDVVSRFAELWQVNCYLLSKRAAHHKQPFSATLTSVKAAQCMKLILSYMGIRRAECIRRAMLEHSQHKAALTEKRRLAKYTFSDDELSAAWKVRYPCVSFRKFCTQFGNCNREATYRRLVRLGLIETIGETIKEKQPELEGLSVQQESATVQNAWLAGLLEGEGSFTNPGPGSVRIGLEMTDEDVVAQAAHMMATKYRVLPARNAQCKPTYLTIVHGDRAAAVMERILPWMGERRSAKIHECLEARAKSKTNLAADRTAFAIAREASLPAVELTARWTTRVAPANLSSFAREYGVHPQIMKNRLVELGVYSSPAYKSRTDVTHTCGFCSTPFVRKASARGGQYCSRGCSGRAVQQRRHHLA